MMEILISVLLQIIMINPAESLSMTVLNIEVEPHWVIK